MPIHPDEEGLEDRIRSLLSKGQKIEAIRIYREATGASLASAKAAVDALEQGRPLRSLQERRAFDRNSEQELLALLQEGKKIEAIKLYREKTGAALKDAKDAVEAMGREHGLLSERSGCAGTLLALLALLVS